MKLYSTVAFGISQIDEAAQSVREEVHSLLILLCTSSKKGLLFRERNTTLGKNANQLISTLLEVSIRPPHVRV